MAIPYDEVRDPRDVELDRNARRIERRATIWRSDGSKSNRVYDALSGTTGYEHVSQQPIVTSIKYNAKTGRYEYVNTISEVTLPSNSATTKLARQVAHDTARRRADYRNNQSGGSF